MRDTLVMGYAVCYLRGDNTVRCGGCASLTDAQLPYWEGPAIDCEDCDAPIESSYGDPN